MAITFKVNDVKIRENEYLRFKTSKEAFQWVTDKEVEACSDGKFMFADFRVNALISAIDIAWSNHRPLVLTPDAVWLTIVNGLAKHINSNSEELRNQFVDFEGKKILLFVVMNLLKVAQTITGLDVLMSLVINLQDTLVSIETCLYPTLRRLA